ncbi:Myosin regulatory light chain, EF-Hand protein superfamily [Phaffia rhodozyma]|uniref:Myosin regulatory light chain, EF-Hand protein superfamily n=1 Tax=Phaffia rhodozyma TaxID=264483 RepID=A0A0F7SHD8_PHARH|nr:Myosin regulatory light chain, EF-Hand protein superfamily [Phaffia rhodozyma]
MPTRTDSPSDNHTSSYDMPDLSSLGAGFPGRLQRSGQPRVPSAPLYTLFSPSQIKQFQEAFNLIDSDRDGLISPSDLTQTLSNLGQSTDRESIRSFASDTDGSTGINFTKFLTMMGDHLLRLDKDDILEEAFGCFDEKDEGVVALDELRDVLANTGDKMSPEEIDTLFSTRFTDSRRNAFNYRDFVNSLKVNDPETETR